MVLADIVELECGVTKGDGSLGPAGTWSATARGICVISRL
jgi:hypothetical protein